MSIDVQRRRPVDPHARPFGRQASSAGGGSTEPSSGLAEEAVEPGDHGTVAETSPVLSAADRALLQQRLLTRFSPAVSPDEVARSLDEAIIRFAAAPVRTYLLVLVERAAADRLRAGPPRKLVRSG